MYLTAILVKTETPTILKFVLSLSFQSPLSEFKTPPLGNAIYLHFRLPFLFKVVKMMEP